MNSKPWRGLVRTFLFLWCIVSATRVSLSEDPYDLLILGGKILDGTANPWCYADIGIKGDKIVAVGQLRGSAASRLIEAEGLTITPGFIDLHTHAFDDYRPGNLGSIPEQGRRRLAPNLVSQGVTTVVTNQDGRGGWPIADQARLLESGGIGPNVILLVGHGVVRQLAMGDDFRRPARVAEVAEMRRLVREGMKQGALGISAGLEYVPGRWSDTEELVAIVSEIVPYEGVFIEHERASGADPMWYMPSQDPPGQPTVLDSITESIEIAERTGATVVCTHAKSKGVKFWGAGRAIIQLIQSARDRGVDIWADSYPYNTTGSDGNTVLIPDWVQGPDPGTALREALEDPARAMALRTDIAHEIGRRGGAEALLLMEYPDQELVGKTLSEIASQRKRSIVEAAIQLALEGFPDQRGGARFRGFSLSEIDVEMFARQPWASTASDAGIALPGDGFVHPRFYGTFPRKIREYAMERKVLTVADAVRSMTSLPAQILHLRDRGVIREGSVADLVILDLEKIRDKATFFAPHQYAEGVRYVMINGVFAVEESRLTGSLPGKVIRRNGSNP